jgi:hypothetical protein
MFDDSRRLQMHAVIIHQNRDLTPAGKRTAEVLKFVPAAGVRLPAAPAIAIGQGL